MGVVAVSKNIDSRVFESKDEGIVLSSSASSQVSQILAELNELTVVKVRVGINKRFSEVYWVVLRAQVFEKKGRSYWHANDWIFNVTRLIGSQIPSVIIIVIIIMKHSFALRA